MTESAPLARDPEAATPSRPEKLDRDECLRLITPGGVGRIAFGGCAGPVILPVNYLIVEGAVLIRTAIGGPMDEDLRSGVEGCELVIAFEVDRYDHAAREGWSVLIRGGAHHVVSDSEHAAAASSGLESWAGGEREQYIKVVPVEITGRRVARF
jgi:nitroimidazol reductase NimA-like FMN-containing flavoprotein (pyridoxamine 5'-phosphate oxidase superfamily)